LRRHPEAAGRLLALAPGISESYLGEAAAMTPERARAILYAGQFAAFKLPDTAGGRLARHPGPERERPRHVGWRRESHARIRELLGDPRARG